MTNGRSIGVMAIRFDDSVGLRHGSRSDDLGDHPDLHLLRLWYRPKVTAQGFAPVAKYTTLEHLDIGNNECPRRRCSGALGGLRSLVLDQTDLGDEGLAEIARLKSLEYLSSNSTKVTDAGIAARARHPTLKTVRLGWTKIGRAALDHLAKIKTLESVETFDCSKLPKSKRAHLTRADLAS